MKKSSIFTYFLNLVLTISAICFIPHTLQAQANINESSISQTLYASPSGVDTNNGLFSSFPKSLNGAVSSAASTNSKIILLNGDYRQWLNIPSGTSILILEAQNFGQAFITGSDRFTNWTDIGGGLFTVPWTNNWGVVNSGFPGDWSAYSRRTEMLFINDSRLLQLCDSNGNSVGNGSIGAGQFTVNEGSDTITFRPASGVSMNGSTKLEVTMRGNSDHLIQTNGRSNLVLRGLVVRHHGGAINQRMAVRLQGDSGSNPALNTRIEDCEFIQNNGVGLQLNNSNNVSLLRVKADRNGSRGFGILGVKNFLATESSFSSNNWRVGKVNAGHDAAGFKIFDGQLNEFTSNRTDAVTLLRCTLRDNLCVGFWQDYGGKNVTIDSCLFENNEQGGIMQEMTPGPLTIKDSVIRNNGVWGVHSYGAPNVKIRNNYIYGTRPSAVHNSDAQYCPEISLIIDNRQSTALAGTDPSDANNTYGHLKGFEITGNVIQAINSGGNPIFYATDYGNSSNPNWPAKMSFVNTVISNNNTWWRANGNGSFNASQAFHSTINYNDWRNPFTDIDFNQWKSARGQDANSTFGAANLSNVPDPTLGGGPTPTPTPQPTPSPTAPSFSNNPSNVTILTGNSTTFSVSAQGDPAPNIQWQRAPSGSSTYANLSSNGTYSGVNGTTLTVSNANTGMSGDRFRAVATNSAGSATSLAATLTVNAPASPIINSALSASATTGSGFSYSITATNSPSSYGASNLPAGLSVNTSNGVISGTPTTAGTTNATISATNSGGTGSATLVFTVTAPSSGSNNGTGLRGQYFNNTSLSGSPALTRTDATIDFGWGSGPGSGLGSENFSVRWEGEVEAPVAGNYTFTTLSDDGIRLWVNGNQVINNWTDHGTATDNSPSIALAAGVRYSIRLEFYQGGGGAETRLRWNYPGQSSTTIPASRLYPATGGSVAQPVISSGLSASATTGSGFSYSITATNSPSSYGASNLPAGLSVNTSNGVISGTPTTAGTTNATISATNSGGTGSATLAFTVTAPSSGSNNGTGLRGLYYNNMSFAGNPTIDRTDSTVNFSWSDSPGAGVGSDNFTVRWVGRIEAPVTGTYTISTETDDGVRVWIDGNQISNNWNDQGPTVTNGTTVNLVAGTLYRVVMEYYENGGGAVARLRWSYPGQGTTIIPQSRLYAAPGTFVNVPNGSFESNVSQTPSNWQTWANSTATESADYSETANPRIGSNNLRHAYGSGAYQVYTYQTLTGLTNGTYLVRCWSRSSGGQNYTAFEVRGFGGSDQSLNLTAANSNYIERTISVNVTNGQMTIAFWSDATASNQWLNIDEITLTRTSP